ncbi:MAG: hypothetical protein V7K25_12090 [Nostoc sp.]|uniref:hypothetical protein n=1 Tax=Nostoc sp. TaxID=1180 RepID=UPI002FF5EB2F
MLCYQNRLIILPGDPEFDWTLQTSIPPHWRQVAQQDPNGFAFCARAESGVLEPMTDKDLEEYLYGGEYDERLEQIGEADLEFA